MLGRPQRMKSRLLGGASGERDDFWVGARADANGEKSDLHKHLLLGMKAG